MWRSILILFISGAVCFGANGGSPEGTWATEIVGHDKGICYLTFSNDFTEVGYGIALDALGPFQVAGTWDLDKHNRLVGGFTEFIDNGSKGAQFEGKVNHNQLRAHAKSTDGRFSLKGQSADSIADLTGSWGGKVKRNGRPFFMVFSSALSTNRPAWFDLSGNGVNDTGTFTLSGGIVITPDNRVAAYTMYDYGATSETDAFTGKLVKRGRKLVLRGRTENGQPANIRAERQQ